jgi:transcriptional regulator with XRE-family HTH domain
MLGMVKLPPWGEALERLRGDRSFRSMEVARLVGIPQYKRMLRSKLGPSVAVLDRWLKGMGYTWLDWAAVYESVEAKGLHAAERPAEYARRRPLRPGARKLPQHTGRKKAAGS